MYFKYGGHQHPDNEVNLTTMTQRRVLNDRGLQMFIVKQLHLEFELLYDTQAELTSRINEVERAYQNNDLDAALYEDDDTTTPHRLGNSSSLTGVFVRELSWPSGSPDQYATTRTGRVVLEAWYFDVESQIVSFHETLDFSGTTGTRWRYREIFNGLPRRQHLNTRTVQRIRQFGSSVSLKGYLDAPRPIFPSQEHGDLRRIGRGSPRLFRNTFLDWPTTWSYEFSSIGSLSGQPNRR